MVNTRKLLNKKAPYYSLSDQEGKIRTLSDYKGKWIALYFYPKDDTPGCTKEACSFRDNLESLTQKNTVVIGVSADSVMSHKKFAEKHNLTYPLLSDTETKVIISYGAWRIKKFMGREYEGILRNTYLINPQGIIKRIYEKVTPQNHAIQIFDDIATLS